MVKDTKNELKEELVEYIDSKFDQASDELHRHMKVLTEDAEESFLKTSHDTISVHDDRLNNHESRITRVEQVVGV